MALDDFYDWTPSGVTNFVMLAGSSQTITDFDIWMMRDWWRHLASRYVTGVASTAAKTTTVIKTTTTTIRVATTSSKAGVITTKAATTAVRTTAAVTTSKTASSGTGAALYAQCAGSGWTGAKGCATGTCKFINEWYSKFSPACELLVALVLTCYRPMCLEHERLPKFLVKYLLVFGAGQSLAVSSTHIQFYIQLMSNICQTLVPDKTM